MPKGIYQRAPRAPKAYPADTVGRVRALYESGNTQDEIAAALGMTQKVVWRLMRHHKIAARPAVVRKPLRGPLNPFWKGDAAGYQALHVRVDAARGKLALCTRCGSAGDPLKIYEWANLTGRYTDIHDFERMCRDCHRRYDNARRGGAPGKRHDVTTERVLELRSGGLSLNAIARHLGTSWPTVRSRIP